MKLLGAVASCGGYIPAGETGFLRSQILNSHIFIEHLWVQDSGREDAHTDGGSSFLETQLVDLKCK
jgi:hypothetical protein